MSRVQAGSPKAAPIIGSMSAQIELDELRGFAIDEYSSLRRVPGGDGYEQVLEVRTPARVVAPAGLPELPRAELLRAAAA